jgi:hypothetical protein
MAEKQRNLSNNWFFSKGEIIEISLTACQFTDLISSFNMGDGVPCTLKHVNVSLAKQFEDNDVPPCPEVNERQQFEAEFKKDMAEIGQSMENLIKLAEALQKKPSINKGDRQAFVDIAKGIQCKISNSLPFVQSQFNEAVDSTLTDARADLQAFTEQLTRYLGSEALVKKLIDAGEQNTEKLVETLKLSTNNETQV